MAMMMMMLHCHYIAPLDRLWHSIVDSSSIHLAPHSGWRVTTFNSSPRCAVCVYTIFLCIFCHSIYCTRWFPISKHTAGTNAYVTHKKFNFFVSETETESIARPSTYGDMTMMILCSWINCSWTDLNFSSLSLLSEQFFFMNEKFSVFSYRLVWLLPLAHRRRRLRTSNNFHFLFQPCAVSCIVEFVKQYDSPFPVFVEYMKSTCHSIVCIFLQLLSTRCCMEKWRMKIWARLNYRFFLCLTESFTTL